MTTDIKKSPSLLQKYGADRILLLFSGECTPARMKGFLKFLQRCYNEDQHFSPEEVGILTALYRSMDSAAKNGFIYEVWRAMLRIKPGPNPIFTEPSPYSSSSLFGKTKLRIHWKTHLRYNHFANLYYASDEVRFLTSTLKSFGFPVEKVWLLKGL